MYRRERERKTLALHFCPVKLDIKFYALQVKELIFQIKSKAYAVLRKIIETFRAQEWINNSYNVYFIFKVKLLHKLHGYS